ncbi:MAG: glutathione S-transferase family protein [Halobacteriovoraceae bacterium]|jgi:glutathione S-transferase|nr:glutathione S-transferase family protein [Halobacteriovoraceae bacterium]MBT5095028.1 glutathione S-transferase family protein [Halobacteriovoraceae bacterium]
MKLYEFSISRSIRVRWMLKEMQVDCEIIPINLQDGGGQAPEFLEINPLGKVPALVDGDLKLLESVAIMTYLGDKYPEKELVPKAGTSDRARYDQWMCFGQNELDAILWTMAKHRWLYPEAMRVPEVNASCTWELERNLKVLDDHLSKNTFLLGTQFTAADIMMGHTVGWAHSADIGRNFNHLMEYSKTLQERPGYPREIYDKK